MFRPTIVRIFLVYDFDFCDFQILEMSGHRHSPASPVIVGVGWVFAVHGCHAVPACEPVVTSGQREVRTGVGGPAESVTTVRQSRTADEARVFRADPVHPKIVMTVGCHVQTRLQEHFQVTSRTWIKIGMIHYWWWWELMIEWTSTWSVLTDLDWFWWHILYRFIAMRCTTMHFTVNYYSAIRCGVVQCSGASVVRCGEVRCSAVQCSAVQCSAVRCGAVRCGAARCGAVQCSAVQCSAVRFSAVQCSALHCTAVHCTALQCSAVQCSAVQCSAVQCSAVQCSAVQCSAVQCSAVQCSAVQCSSVQCSAVQCSAVQCSAVQCSAVQCSAVQCSAVQCSAVQCSAVQCSAVQCSAVQCSAVQCSAVQCSAVQCSAVQCSAVQCSAVQCSAVQCSAVQCSAGAVQCSVGWVKSMNIYSTLTSGERPTYLMIDRDFDCLLAWNKIQTLPYKFVNISMRARKGEVHGRLPHNPQGQPVTTACVDSNRIEVSTTFFVKLLVHTLFRLTAHLLQSKFMLFEISAQRAG